MTESTLFFCRTPLQAIIINNLLDRSPGRHHVIYRPNNNSKKHEYYFNKLRTKNKTLLSFEPIPFSHALSSIVEWFFLARNIRSSKYDNLYIASIGDMVFSFFAARNKLANIFLFDDGFINLNEWEFTEWVKADSLSKKIVRTLFRGEKTEITYERISHHCSIYPANLCWLNCETTEMAGLFKVDNIEPCTEFGQIKKLRVLLGSAYILGEILDDVQVIKSRNILHEKIIHSNKFDVYIPHPAHPSQHFFPENLQEFSAKHPLHLMIAEDIISALHNAGYQLIIYGFVSSALVNLSKDFKTVSIILDDQMMHEANLHKQLGAKIIKVF